MTVFAISVAYTMALETTTVRTSSIAPLGDRSLGIRRAVLDFINTERWREGIQRLQLRDTGLAQRHSRAVLDRNEIIHNGELPYDAAETVLLASYGRDSVDLVVIDMLVRCLVLDEADRRLLLGSEYNSVDIGVSYTDYRVCLVIDYYERGLKD